MAIKPYDKVRTCSVCRSVLPSSYLTTSLEWVEEEESEPVKRIQMYCSVHWKEVREYFKEQKESLLQELNYSEGAGLTVEMKHALTSLFFDRLMNEKEWEV